jgi:hypothetical protein
MLSLLTTLAQSELKYVNKKFVCDDTSVLMDELVNGEYNEKPIWRGIDSETKTIYGVLMNSKTGTWTIIQFDGKMTCVLGVGEEAKLLTPGSKNVKQH